MATFTRSSPAVALALVVSGLMCSTAWAQESPIRTVLTIHRGTEDFYANTVIDAGIRDTLTARSDLRVDYFAEYLESDRFGSEEETLAFRDYLRRKYQQHPIDLVITITNESLQFALDHRAELFPKAPIVSAALDAPADDVRRAGPGVAALTVGIAHAETLKLALELHPSTERVFIVANAASKLNNDSVRAELAPFSRQVQLTYLDEPTLPRLLDAVQAIPPHSLVFYIWDYVVGKSGKFVSADEIARAVAVASPVPVYSTYEGYVGLGIVGGVMRGVRETGVRAADMAIEILKGTLPQAIPVENARIVPTFDWRQLRRWRIDASRLPAGSNIRFRLPTTWESYRSYIIGIAIIVGAQLVLITALLVQRAHLHRAEETVRAREATLRKSFDRIRHLAGRLITVEEATRANVARDLHDDLCQELVGLCMTVSALRDLCCDVQDAAAQKELSSLQHRTLDMVQGIRQMSHDLHPAGLRLVGLAGALNSYCVEVEKRHDVQVGFTVAGNLGLVPPDAALCLFRIAQEALRNGAVHGDARRLGVSLTRRNEDVELTITDNGRGFDLEAVRATGSGLGLVSMEERAHMVGGYVEITTGVESGTTVYVRVPAGVDQSEESEHVAGRPHLPGVPALAAE